MAKDYLDLVELEPDPQYGIPRIDLDQLEQDPEVRALLPFELCQTHRCLPLIIAGGHLIVAMVDPTDLVAIHEIRQRTDLMIEIVVADAAALTRALGH